MGLQGAGVSLFTHAQQRPINPCHATPRMPTAMPDDPSKAPSNLQYIQMNIDEHMLMYARCIQRLIADPQDASILL